MHLGCGALFGVWDASPDSVAAYAVTARGAAHAVEKLSTTMTTDPDGKPYAHNEEQSEAAKLAAISEAAICEAVPEHFLLEIARLAIASHKSTEAYTAGCEAQIDMDIDNTSDGTMHAKDAYDRMSADAEKLREAIDRYLSSPNVASETPRP